MAGPIPSLTADGGAIAAGRGRPRMVIGAAGLCLLGATLTPSIHADPIDVNIVWSFMFAATIALAFGRAAALTVGLLGIAPIPFILWPNNGWANLVGAGYYLTWLVWLGWTAQSRTIKSRWWTSPLAVQAAMIPVQAVVFLVLFPPVLGLNPPPWQADAVTAIPAAALKGLIVKDGANLLFCLLGAMCLLKLVPVRRLLGLPVPTCLRLNGRVIGASVASLAVLWLALLALDSFLIEGTFPDGWLDLHAPHEAVALFLTAIAALAAALAICHFTEGRLRAADELLAAERALRATLERLQAANIEMERFTTVAAHDLQEPVRTVVSFAQLLEQSCGEALTANGREYLAFVVEGARRMKALVAALLDYSHIAYRAIRTEPVETRDLLDGIVTALRPTIADRPATIDIGATPTVMGDREQLRQLFGHLLGNALKFHSPGDVATVSVGAAPTADGFWEFSITDNGIGIPADYQATVFEAFRRLHPIGQFPGVGIGLALARHIVQEHGGRIWIASGVPGNTVFKFTLPAPPPTSRS